MEHTAFDGKKYKTQFYNLDAIISVGYRINSERATQFRIWATKILKRYLIQGYALNEKRLIDTKNKLLSGQEGEILNLLAVYSKTLLLLEQYDKGKLVVKRGIKAEFVLKYENCIKIITELKKELVVKKQAGNLFGVESDKSFEGIIKGLYQTFLFVYFLDKSQYLFKKTGERKINDNALVALALLVAESDPKDKEVMIKIIKNLITE